jgi:hypothetical protein
VQVITIIVEGAEAELLAMMARNAEMPPGHLVRAAIRIFDALVRAEAGGGSIAVVKDGKIVEYIKIG